MSVIENRHLISKEKLYFKFNLSKSKHLTIAVSKDSGFDED